MKKRIFALLIVIFSSIAMADNQSFIGYSQNIILQNTTDHDLLIYYYSCIQAANDAHNKVCTLTQSEKLKAKSSNFSKPIVLSIDQMSKYFGFTIPRVLDLTSGVSHSFPAGCNFSSGMGSINPNNIIFTFSSLIDNDSIIQCSRGYAIK